MTADRLWDVASDVANLRLCGRHGFLLNARNGLAVGLSRVENIDYSPAKFLMLTQ